MEMIPALLQAGYEYVVVDSVHVQPQDGIPDIYQPYLACHEDQCITVIPRDRTISNAQESGLNPSWFANEIQHKVWESPRPQELRLVTTWSDGENGGWFRQTDEDSGFFGFFFAPYMEQVRLGGFPCRTVSLSTYIKQHKPQQQAHVQTGAWNVGSTSGYDFAQWAGSESQRRALAKVVEVSGRYHRLAAQAGDNRATRPLLEQARHLLLEGETSCYLFWGDSWIPHLYACTEQVEKLLSELETAITTEPAAPTSPKPVRQKQPAATTPSDKSTKQHPTTRDKALGRKKSAKKLSSNAPPAAARSASSAVKATARDAAAADKPPKQKAKGGVPRSKKAASKKKLGEKRIIRAGKTDKR